MFSVAGNDEKVCRVPLAVWGEEKKSGRGKRPHAEYLAIATDAASLGNSRPT